MGNLAELDEDTSPYVLACVAADEARAAYWQVRNRLPSETVEGLDKALDQIHEDYMKARDDRIAQFEAENGLSELSAAMTKADAICAEYETGEDDED